MNPTPWLALLGTLSLGACATPPAAVAPPRSVHASLAAPLVVPGSETPESWFHNGAERAAATSAAPARARNAILFLGDGMSEATVAAARILDGQRQGRSGEENLLSFERFPYTALSKTYETDQQTPDSSGTMTAIMTGVKTRAGVVGIDQRARRGDCPAARQSELLSALELAVSAKLATGIVTTTRVTHATPAATYAHAADRGWESDTDLPAAARAQGCADIAQQLIDSPFRSGIDVVLGGGRAQFMRNDQRDPEYPDLSGKRADGRDLIAEWQHATGAAYVWNAQQLAALDLARTPRVLGLFEPSHMHYEHERARNADAEPSLAQMTRAALGVLKSNPRGFFLVVEGGRIDHGHHAGNAYRALTETIEFARAIEVANAMTSADETLILVTADHSHSMNFVGYPARGNPILGKVRGVHGDGPAAELATDLSGLPYATLSYANGPGHAGASDEQTEGAKRYPHYPKKVEPARKGRPDLSQVDTEDPDFEQEAMLPLDSETHGGEDVAVYARGPGADAVRGVLEQNTLFHILVQNTESLRAQLCQFSHCDARGISTQLPDRRAVIEALPARR